MTTLEIISKSSLVQKDKFELSWFFKLAICGEFASKFGT